MNKKWLKKSVISVAVMGMALGTAITANAEWKQQQDGQWYYETAGVRQTGWYNDNGTWYFMNSSGVMLTGVIEVDGKVYYLNDSGALVIGNAVVNGKNYTFDLYGISEKLAPAVSGRYYGNGHTAVRTTSSGGSGSSSKSTFTPDIKDMNEKVLENLENVNADLGGKAEVSMTNISSSNPRITVALAADEKLEDNVDVFVAQVESVVDTILSEKDVKAISYNGTTYRGDIDSSAIASTFEWYLNKIIAANDDYMGSHKVVVTLEDGSKVTYNFTVK